LQRHPHFWAYFALSAVCVLWGTTYLAIRMALEAFPPGHLLGLRFVLSGGILLAGARLRRAYIPTGREMVQIALSGLLIIGLGTGTLVFAETWIPSGLAALFISTSPFWMTAIETLWPGGSRPTGAEIAGLAVGLTGTALLLWSSALASTHPAALLGGFLLLQLGCAGWAAGSVFRRRIDTRAHPVVTGAIQQLACGVTVLIPALLFEPSHVHFSTRGLSALFYLVLFGSIVGYSAYAYALDRLPVALVSIYTYVNPAVAVFLGWLFYREPFGVREAMATSIILAGVTIVKRFGRAPGPVPKETPEFVRART
jgi:drug/metabolite transporter (DMT)-like permease